MENRRAGSDQRGRGQHARIVRGKGQGHHADQGETHAEAERVRLWVGVGINPDDRLQNGSAQLISQRDHADLHEAQMEFALQQRVDRDDQRLHHVVEKMRKADGAQNIEVRARRWGGRRSGDARSGGRETLFHNHVPY